MRYCLFLFAFLLSFSVYAQPQQVQLQKMQDYYFVGSESMLKKGVNCFVITEREDMDKLFGTTSRPDTPDFSQEWMLVMVMPMTKSENQLEYKRVSNKAGNFVEIYCDVRTNIHQLTYDHNPTSVCVIPKYEGVSKVDFYNEHKGIRLIQSVTIKGKY